MTVEQQIESVEITAGNYAASDEEVDSKGNAFAPSLTDSSSGESNKDTRDPFFAFIPQIAKWGLGIVTGEAKLVSKGVSSAPSFTKEFLSDTYTFYKANPNILFPYFTWYLMI